MADSNVQIRIASASISSGVDALDEVLRGADYFDSENHPEITFASTAYEETSENGGVLHGDLTVAGTTQPVALDVTINSAAMNPLNRREMIGFSATGSFSRSAFGLDAYSDWVGDELALNVQVEFQKVR